MNRYSLLLVLSMLLVGSNVGVGKAIVACMPVAALAMLRFAVAVVVLGPLLRTAKMRTVKRGEWLNLFLQALVGTFLFTLFMLNGVARTSAMAAGVITSTIPAVVALFAWIFLGEAPNRRTVASILLAITGIATLDLAAPAARHGAPTSLTGNLLILAAVCCESIYIILSRRLTQTLAPLDICTYTHLFGFLLMLPLGLPALAHLDYAGVPASIWPMVIWYGLAASIFSFWLWMKGIRHVPGNVAGVFSAVLPLAAAAYGIAFLGERPTLAHGVALACVLAGIALASLSGRRPVLAES
jgi:drug/metabolite transporter (DMT)-like permease